MGSQDRGFSQFLHTAASYMPESNSSSPDSHPPTQAAAHASAIEGHGKKPPSGGEVLGNAKVVFDAALSQLHKSESESGGSNTLDKAKVAAAAAGVLAAAKHYGKMEDKSYGKYVQQAEDYLNNYGHNSHASSGNSPVKNSTHPAASHSHSSSAHKEDHEENKYSSYLQTAEGLLKKF